MLNVKITNRIVKSLLISIILGLILSSKIYASAAPMNDPVKLVEHVANSVMAELKANKDKLEKNPHLVYHVVDKLVLPYVDFEEMSKWVAGKAAWRAASSAEQHGFMQEFKVLIVNTYATALNKYTNETIEVYPLHTPPAQSRVQVASKVIRANQENIKIDYRLIKRENGWSLYDIIVEGVSILKGFQAQFSEDIHHHGLTYVTVKIHDHNQKKVSNAENGK